MKFMRPCVSAFALSLVIGCGASDRPYTIMPPTSKTSQKKEKYEYRNVRLPNPTINEEVSLHGLLAYADEHSPFLSISRAELSVGDASIEGARPLFPKDLSVSLSAGPRIGPGGTGIDLSVGLQQQLELSGARALRIEAANQLRNVKQMELEEARWLVHQRVHALFHQALVSRNRIETASEFLTFSESLLSIAERRLKAGDISPLGVRVAKGELAQARQTKIAIEGEYRSIQLTLAEIAGWTTKTLPVPAGRLDVPRRAPDVPYLVDLAQINNPQLQTRIAKTRVAEANVHLAKREVWPKPSVGFQYNRESDPTMGVSGGAEADVFLFSIGFPIPVWRKNIVERSNAKAVATVAHAKFTGEQQRLSARVQFASNQVNVGADRIAAYGEEILPAFEKNLALLKRTFELGEIEVLEVSVAQRRFLKIQQSALDAYQEYYQAVALLEQIVGAEVWPNENHDIDEGDQQ